MSYNRKFEDSYLDQEQEEIDELMKTANAESRLVILFFMR